MQTLSSNGTATQVCGTNRRGGERYVESGNGYMFGGGVRECSTAAINGGCLYINGKSKY